MKAGDSGRWSCGDPQLATNQGPQQGASRDLPEQPSGWRARRKRRSQIGIFPLSPSQSPNSHLKVTGKTRNFAAGIKKTSSHRGGVWGCSPVGMGAFRTSLG